MDEPKADKTVPEELQGIARDDCHAGTAMTGAFAAGADRQIALKSAEGKAEDMLVPNGDRGLLGAGNQAQAPVRSDRESGARDGQTTSPPGDPVAKRVRATRHARQDEANQAQEVQGSAAADPRDAPALGDDFLKIIGRADVNGKDSSNLTALHHAVTLGDHQAVAALLDDGRFSSADAQGGPYERTALHLAAERGDVRTVALLLDHARFGGTAGAADAQDSSGHTALHRAAAGGRASVVSALLGHARFSAGDAVDKDARTALHRAAYFGHAAAARALLAHPRFTSSAAGDHAGETALDVAAQRGHDEVFSTIRNSIGGGE